MLEGTEAVLDESNNLVASHALLSGELGARRQSAQDEVARIGAAIEQARLDVLSAAEDVVLPDVTRRRGSPLRFEPGHLSGTGLESVAGRVWHQRGSGIPGHRPA